MTPGIAQICIHALVENIEATPRGGNMSSALQRISLVAIAVLQEFASIHAYIRISGSATVPRMMGKICDWAHGLAQHVRFHDEVDDAGRRLLGARLVEAVLNMSLAWILVMPSLLTLPECGHALVRLMVDCCDKSKNFATPHVKADRILRKAGAAVLHHVCLHSGNPCTSASATFRSRVFPNSDAYSTVRHYALRGDGAAAEDGRILSVYELSADLVVGVIIRDAHGMYAWKARSPVVVREDDGRWRMKTAMPGIKPDLEKPSKDEGEEDF